MINFYQGRLADRFLRLLALGVVCCGGTIIWSGFVFLEQSREPFRENLHSLAETITELDQTVAELREQSAGVDAYLGVLQAGLGQLRADLREVDKTSGALLDLAGGSGVDLLKETGEAVTGAAKLLKQISSRLAKIPFDPLVEQRKTLRSMAGNFTNIATELDGTAEQVSAQAKTLLTSGGLANTGRVVDSTDEQLGILRQGPVERLPGVLQALSKQLSAHAKLIDASYNLLDLASLPVFAVGVGFVLLGLRGLFLPRAGPVSPAPIAASGTTAA